MTDPITCLKCGAPLAGGSCPRCLLAAGLESGAAGAPPSSAPSPAEMQKHFPGMEVLELLGQGGMGIVYKARQKNLDRFVALKVLLPEIAREAGFAERFTREARTLARLQHPRIVGVHDFGESDGLWFLVMEYVDGTNLRQVMRSGGLGPKEALAIVPQVCDALQYAHDQGIVHRDIKPENILVDRSGGVKIADFGLAKLLQRAPVELNITRTGQVMGTLHYMAPEQYRAPEGVDHRADIYSLGVVFYEMLTGDLPVGSFPRPSSRAGVDARLDGVVMRAMERERDQRYQKASEVRTAVDGITSGHASAPTMVAAAAAAAAVPESAPPMHRWALAGVLALPAGLVAYFLVRGFVGIFASSSTAGSAGGWVLMVVLLAGWIASIIAWAQIHHSGGKLAGKAWAIAGTFLNPFFLCCSGSTFMGAPDRAFHMGKDGFRLPGMTVEEGPDGTRVRMPGLEVDDGPGGTRVKMPGLEVSEGPGDGATTLLGTIENPLPGMTTGQKLAILKAIDRSWEDYVEVWTYPKDERVHGLYLRDDRDVLEKLTWQEKSRENGAYRLGVPMMEFQAYQGHEPKELRLARVILDETGSRARVVRTDGRLVLSYPAEQDSSRWRFRIGPVHFTHVSGGPKAATPRWMADAVRGLEKLWDASGTALLKEQFPGTDLADRASLFRIHALALRPNSTSGRMVWTDGGVTISLACHFWDGKWAARHTLVQRLDRAPEFSDRDGWLGDEPEPAGK